MATRKFEVVVAMVITITKLCFSSASLTTVEKCTASMPMFAQPWRVAWHGVASYCTHRTGIGRKQSASNPCSIYQRPTHSLELRRTSAVHTLVMDGMRQGVVME